MSVNEYIPSPRRIVEEAPGRQRRLDQRILAGCEAVTLRECGFTWREIRAARARLGIEGPGYDHGRGKRWAY